MKSDVKAVITADFHIGINDAHDLDVLNGCREIGKVKPDLLILAGDVYDRTRPSPEMYRRFGDCLTAMNAKEYYIIPGNHDRSSSYATVQAFMSDFWKRDDVRFMIEDTVVFYKDLNIKFFPFCPSTDFGMDVTEAIQDSQDVGHIIVTHTDIPGAIYGAEQEIQLGEVGSLAPIDKNKARLIISGHIHRYQAGTFGGIPFFFPGSLARVSHSEENEAKGFVMLDIKTLQWKFVPRKTARKWITVNIDWKGKLPVIDKKADVIRVNLRATSKYRGSINRTMIERNLAKQFDQVKLNIEYTQKQSKEAENAVKGISFAEYEDKWVDTYAKGNKTAVNKMIKKVMSHVDESLKTTKEYFGLTLKEVQLINFQTISRAFKKFKPTDCIGILGMFNGQLKQSNGSGKSSFIEGIKWVLYGSTRYSTNVSAVRDGTEKAEGIVKLQSAKGDVITIERTQTDKKGGCFVYDGKGNVLAKGKEVATWVEANCGLNLKTFDSVIYIGGESKHNIVGARPTDRLRAFQEPLPLERYTKGCLDVIKRYRSENKSTIEQIRGVVQEYESNLLNDLDLKDHKDDIKSLKESILEQRTILKENEIQYKKLNAEEKIVYKVELLKDELDTLDKELTENKEDLQDSKELFKKKNLSELKKELADNKSKLHSLQKEQAQVETDGKSCKDKISELTEEIAFLSAKAGNSVCPTCKREWDNESMLIHKKNLSKILSEKLDERDRAAEKYKEYKTQISQLNHQVRKMERDVDDAKELELDIKNIAKNISDLETKKVTLKAKLTQESKGKKFREIGIIKREIKKIEKDISEIRDEIEEMNNDLVDLSQELKADEQSRARLAVAQAKLDKAEKEQLVLNICYDAFSPRGIPQFVVMSVIEEVTRIIPDVIADFGFWQDIDVTLEPDDSKAASTIAIWAKIGNKKRREYEGLSQGEKEITNFIVRMAYKRVLENLIDINYSFVMIDEALDVLDKANLEASIKYFKKAKMQSLCISHSDLQDAFTKTVIVDNRDGVAEVM